jgi:hypothetical protein
MPDDDALEREAGDASGGRRGEVGQSWACQGASRRAEPQDQPSSEQGQLCAHARGRASRVAVAIVVSRDRSVGAGRGAIDPAGARVNEERAWEHLRQAHTTLRR